MICLVQATTSFLVTLHVRELALVKCNKLVEVGRARLGKQVSKTEDASGIFAIFWDLWASFGHLSLVVLLLRSAKAPLRGKALGCGDLGAGAGRSRSQCWWMAVGSSWILLGCWVSNV